MHERLSESRVKLSSLVCTLSVVLLLFSSAFKGTYCEIAMKSSKISYWKQFVNVPALLRLKEVLSRPRCLLPAQMLRSVADIDCYDLKHKHGVKYIVFDKDNTLR